jgi:5-methylcytosine-specific restriction endonuclease McrA
VSRAPTADEQLIFLTKIQRLFVEGEFTATYKFALLISLTELAVEVPPLGGESELEISVRSIANKFIELYWRQSYEYVAGRPGANAGVLVQNLGDQAAVVSAIRAFRSASGAAGSSLVAARRLPAFRSLVSRVATVVSAQPLRYLQNFGGDTDEFLYTRGRAGFILLLPGVTYCLRRFQPLIQQLARVHWVDHIRANRRNALMLGEASDLEVFLFSSSRASLARLGEGLRQLLGASCFYCGGAMHEVDVDHFVPFASYPRDLGHNFVLAHPTCNRSKSDTLAAYDHLSRWLDRNERWSVEIAEISEDAGITQDLAAARLIGRWGYASAQQSQGRAWITAGNYERVEARHVALFGN